MHKKFLILLSFFLVQANFSQKESLDQKIDSIFSLSLKSNDEKIKAYESIAKQFRRMPAKKAVEKLENLLSKDDSDVAKMIFYKGLSSAYAKLGESNKSLKLKLEGLNTSQKLNDEVNIIYYNLAISNDYKDLNKLDKAMYHINEAERISEKKANEEWLCSVYHSKGGVFEMLNETDKSATAYEKAWKHCKNFEDAPHQKFLLYTLVQFYSANDFPQKQEKYINLLAEKYEENDVSLPRGHLPVVDILRGQIKEDNIANYQEVLEISDSLGNVNSFVVSSIILNEIFTKIGNPHRGISYLKKAKIVLDSVQKPSSEMMVYKKLAESHLAISDYKSAYEYKQMESKLRDSVISERTKRSVAELEIKYETEKKDREIAQQTLEIEIKDNQKARLLGGLIGLGVLMLLSGFFFWKRLQYQKTIASQNEAIQEQKIIELQQQNKLLALNSMIEGQEGERMRIAKDLHDSLGGLLSTVKAHFIAIQNEIEQLEKINLTEKTNELIDEACVEVRRISHNMIPHALTLSGLPVALEDMAEALRAEGYQVDLNIKNFQDKMAKTKQAMLFRLVQEVIANIRKHAKAKNILIQILGDKNGLSLIMEDDGAGFDYEKAILADGVGLKSINSRVEFLNGTIDWDTALGEGTTITINIPRA